jgi:hypothetical protein
MGDEVDPVVQTKLWKKFTEGRPELIAARTAWLDHLDHCRQCNQDLDCWACQLQGEAGRLQHSCNCAPGEGYGYLLGKEYQHRVRLALREFQNLTEEEAAKL